MTWRRREKLKGSLIGLFTIALLIQTGCGSARRSEPISGPLPIESSSIANGQKVFMEHCNQCHPQGETGLGPALNNKPLPSFMIRFQVRRGFGAMPAFSKKDISDDQLNDLVEYVRALRRHG
ncbi:MAG: cytochrome c [Candidatus Manganitrophus sp. SA1]|nr:cytochrome c [Candidatus Manganitrophus morganii]